MSTIALVALLAAPAPPLVDLRVGEADGVARVVLVCEGACGATPTADGFVVDGASDALVYEADGPGRLREVVLSPRADGSVLTVRTDGPIGGVSLSGCEPNAVCLDLDLRGDTADDAPSGSLRSRMEAASRLSLSPAACEDAADAVRSDAWALDAFRALALCRALGGSTSQAAAMLERLAAVSPDEEVQALLRLVEEARPPLR